MAKQKLDRKKFYINPFQMVSASVRYDFEELESLAEFIETTIRHELKHIEKWAKDTARKMDPEGRESFYESIGEERQRISQDFKLRLRYGLAVTTYTVIESRLNDACLSYKYYINKAISEQNTGDRASSAFPILKLHQKEISSDYKDHKGKGIVRASNYIGKVLKLSFPKKGNGPWQDIMTLAHIRNCIVHTDGYNNEKKLASLVKSHPQYVRYNDKGQLEIEAAYFTWIIKQAGEFFSELFATNMDLFKN